MTTAESIDFAHTYGLKWVEVREIREKKKEVGLAPEVDVKELGAALGRRRPQSVVHEYLAAQVHLARHGARPRAAQRYAGEERKSVSLPKRSASIAGWKISAKLSTPPKILGCDKVRVFTGSRTADPQSTYPRVVEVFTPMIEEAAKRKIHLLVENEASQNVATSAELGVLVPMIKSPGSATTGTRTTPIPRRKFRSPTDTRSCPSIA